MFIESKLAKASQLIFNSARFPALVHTACLLEGRTYTDAHLYACAANPTVLDRIRLEAGKPIDETILDLLSDPERAQSLDNDLRYIVTTIQEDTHA